MGKGIFLLIIFFNALFINAQEISKNIPFSFSQKKVKVNENILRIKSLNIEEILLKDSIQFVESQQFNVAHFQAFNFSIRNRDCSKLQDSILVYKSTLTLPKARKIAIKFENLFLPKGSELFIYSPKQKNIFLSFSAKNKALILSHFISKPIDGADLVIEYNQSVLSKKEPEISILGFLNFYEKNTSRAPGFGGSTSCEVNTACSEGDDWCQQINSVVKIFIQSGNSYSYCTGSVVNNTKQDKTPYILTAEHCGMYASAEDFKYWTFEFNFQSELCESPASESEIKSNKIIGCEKIAQARRSGYLGSDFRLVKLLDSIPYKWSVNYAGWDAQEYSEITNTGVSIHHPYGDIKKISTYSRKLTSTDSEGGTQSDEYWKTYWDATENGYGITEGGSSGSPLFNSEGLIIGTLATGSSFCEYATDMPDYYGKISKHWLQNGEDIHQQLKPWLDPLNKGILKLNNLNTYQSNTCKKQKIFEEFTIYPNPAQNIITIGYHNLTVLSEATIEIFNLQGKLVLLENTSAIISNKEIDVSSLCNGFYILKLSKASWNIEQKFVILR